MNTLGLFTVASKVSTSLADPVPRGGIVGTSQVSDSYVTEAVLSTRQISNENIIMKLFHAPSIKRREALQNY